MLILEMKVGVNNSIIYKNERDYFQFPIFQFRRKNEKLITCTKDIRRKLRTTQSQLHLLVDERAELTAKVSNVLPILMLPELEIIYIFGLMSCKI